MSRIAEHLSGSAGGRKGSLGGNVSGAYVSVEEVEREIKKLARTLTTKELKRITGKAVGILISTARQMAPVSKRARPRYRYLHGKRVATYYSGNLRRSIGILKLKRSPYTWVGHRKDQEGTGGEMRGGRVDGYYGHMVEWKFNKPHIQPAWEATKQIVYSRIASEIKTFLGT